MDKRRAVRRDVSPEEALSRARLRTGGDLRIIDASSWGALAETTERLLPGRHLDVHMISTEGRLLVRSRVARSFVWLLTANALQYRAALAFERAIDVRVEGYGLPALPLAPGSAPGSNCPPRAVSTEIEFDERPPA